MGCVSAPVAASTCSPPTTAVSGLLIVIIELPINGVATILMPTINPLPGLPTTVYNNSMPFNTTTNSPALLTGTWNVISYTPPGGNTNWDELPATRWIEP